MDKFNIEKIENGNHFLKFDRSELQIMAHKLWRELMAERERSQSLEQEKQRIAKKMSGELQLAQKKEIWRHIKPSPIKAKLHVLYGDLSYLESLVMNAPNIEIDV